MAAQEHGSDEDESQGAGNSPESDRRDEKQGRFRRYIPWILAVVVLVAGIAVLIYHVSVGRFHVSTDDAYVNGNLVRLTPQISGTVIRIAADETQFVQRGQPLIELDRHDTDIALAQADANLGQTLREVTQVFDKLRQEQAAVDAQQAQLAQSVSDYARDRALIAVHGVSQEAMEHDQRSLQAAHANVEQAQAALLASKAAVAGTTVQKHPRVLQAEAQFRSAWINAARTRILAPVSGYIVRRSVQLGQQVTQATEMLALVPLDDLWIDANFKENELRQLRIGQPVQVAADLYGSSVEYHGTVLGLTAGTGSALALLPAQNATGNWIKIVQRLPVRIGLDPEELKNHPLFVGLSTDVDVDVHDLGGSALSPKPAWTAAMNTDVYEAQDDGYADALRRILAENGTPDGDGSSQQRAP